MSADDYLKVLRAQEVAVDHRSQRQLIEAWEQGEQKKEAKNLFKLAQAISIAFGGIEKIETGSLLEDANYWAEIEMGVSRWEKPANVIFTGKRWYGNPPPDMTIYRQTKATASGRLQIRLSNDGHFITIIDEQQVLNTQQIETLVKISGDHGFNYIPMNVLELEYDGGRQPGRKISTSPLGKDWFHRFFDY